MTAATVAISAPWPIRTVTPDTSSSIIDTKVDFTDIRKAVPYRNLIFTGQIDEYFDFSLGRLPYRSLRFDHATLDEQWHQLVSVINYPQTHFILE
jgi:UDP-galactopyranose mutase